MKNKLLSIISASFICLCSIFPSNAAFADEVSYPDYGSTASTAAIVMEASSGSILFSQAANKELYPASITKIMTAYLAIKYGNFKDIVTFSEDAVYKTEGSSILRDVGEELTLEECLYAMMLESANDCAYAIAEHVGGTYDHFIEMMNEAATELGCTHTHFTNPHGLPDEDHYTSVHDMALIAQAAYESEAFRIITGTKEYVLRKTNKHNQKLYMHNHHAMLYPYRTYSYLYDYCVGGKTGYTVAAGSTLVTFAKHNDMTLICVTMNATPPNHYLDTTSLLNFCFDNFTNYDISDYVTSGNTSKIASYASTDEYLSLDEGSCVTVPNGVDFSDLTSEVSSISDSSDSAGVITYYYDDKVVGSAKIKSSSTE